MNRLHNKSFQRGAMLTELLLSVALAAMLLPFLVKFQSERLRRAENLAIAGNMELAGRALEKYITANSEKLLQVSGKNIVRVSVMDLQDFGFPEYFDNDAKIQIRIMKTRERGGRSVLQGVLVFPDGGASPYRTRQIAESGGFGFGYSDRGNISGQFGTWNANYGEMGSGVSVRSGSVRKKNEYIQRLPGAPADAATMKSDLSIGGHDLKNADLMIAKNTVISDTLGAAEIGADKLSFTMRANLDAALKISGEATVNGNMTSDGKSITVGTLSLEKTANFSAVHAKELWAGSLNLSGLYFNDGVRAPQITVRQNLDMLGGKITADIANVGFSGTLTPRIYISTWLQDSQDSSYYWDVKNSIAVFSDMRLNLLRDLSRFAVSGESGNDSEVYNIMRALSVNANATVADYINGLRQMQRIVEIKFEQLNLKD
ncbi:MAG: type II secretion system GspH family protein [Rickettsiales bacterium]|jgi:hypothetical protein|nr:type II secretion system GspH family protein [Rickettsiales bacterium]